MIYILQKVYTSFIPDNKKTLYLQAKEIKRIKNYGSKKGD